MVLLQNAFRRDKKKERSMNEDVHLISITVNPERDSFPALRAYADRYGVNHDYWWFLTGDKKLIYDYARNQLGLSVQPGDGGADDFIHTEKIVILDKDRFVRGYYDGLDSSAIGKAAYDISLLTMEKKRK
jgi:protein SCO1/2